MDWNVINEERKGKRSTRSLRLKALAKDEGTVDFGGGGKKCTGRRTDDGRKKKKVRMVGGNGSLYTARVRDKTSLRQGNKAGGVWRYRQGR